MPEIDRTPDSRGRQTTDSPRPPAFLNKVLMSITTLTHVCIVRGCFHAATGRLSNCVRDWMACKTELLTVWPFPEKVADLYLTGMGGGGRRGTGGFEDVPFRQVAASL